ncbi:transporter substrate-binding domain-containing protein [Pseudomonas sp. J452]|uniref:substrate-binding periplasmic protein n=1 Tax=Pseudomonas sp. J452 TaxID=2898441 RepID=UPI0021ADB3F4|nr:transporter substrate-binding domain-containing protein [Pseudomonas sp. J452]UUY08200.1 transporter substrate-binding domain-containing protein [Pseudomonas sp. J452]
MLLLLISLAGVAQACQKTLRWDDDPPFSMQQANGEVGGIDIDLNRAVLARLGCTVKLVKLPWARALKELELGRLDILPGAFRKPEREVYAHFSGAVLEPSRNILFMHQDALARWPVSDLRELQKTPFRLGAQIDVAYGPVYQQLMADADFASRVSFTTSRANLWQMVKKRRIDGVIADESTGLYETRQLGLDDSIRPTAVVVSTDAAEVAFSKKSNSVEFVESYAQVLRQLIEDGSHDRIVQSYLHD